MSRLSAVVLFCVGISSALGLEPGLRVRFGLTDSFIDLPRSIGDAVLEGWSLAPRPDATLPSLYLMCHANYTVCCLYDDTAYIAGIQIAFKEDEVTDTIYDWEVRGFARWVPGDGNTYWAIQQYFVNQEYLDLPATTRIALRDPNKLLQVDGVWVHGINRTLTHIPSTTSGITTNGFTEQACIPLMGLHHFYEMTSDLSCSAETLHPFFGLTKDDTLIGTGVTAFGILAQAEKEWFERPPRLAVQIIVPRGPECLYELADNPGLITMHIYYVDNPWLILTC